MDLPSLRDTRVLVTGARGFIGRHLTRRLSALGAEIHATTRSATPEKTGTSTELHWHTVDLARVADTRELIAHVRPHLVFHLAGFVAGTRDLDAVASAMEQNLTATVHLLTALHGTSCRRLVHAGSMEEPSGESWPPVPGSPYAAAKFAASTYVRFFHAVYGSPVAIARIFMVYGPDQPDEKKLVPYVIRSLLAGEAPRLSSGSRKVDWIYVVDVVDGLLAMASTPGIEGETLDLGTGVATSVAQVTSTLGGLVAASVQPRLGALPDRPLEGEPVADVETTARRTGWRPQVALNEGLERTVEWYSDVWRTASRK